MFPCHGLDLKSGPPVRKMYSKFSRYISGTYCSDGDLCFFVGIASVPVWEELAPVTMTGPT